LANELLLARDAGLLTFDDRTYGQRLADPQRSRRAS
jgi:hypothetical protein